jgi:hypothetical protein
MTSVVTMETQFASCWKLILCERTAEVRIGGKKRQTIVDVLDPVMKARIGARRVSICRQ